jgi:hypothetical protein
MKIPDLAKRCKALILQYPEHRDEILDIYYYAKDESESGSEDHEVEMAFSDLKEMEDRIKKTGK